MLKKDACYGRMLAFYVIFSYQYYTIRDWLGSTSLKLLILCRVGRNTLTEQPQGMTTNSHQLPVPYHFNVL